MKTLLEVVRAERGHWVGNGFPVRTIFSHHSHGSKISPFLMLDYAGPAEFPPTNEPRGVEAHPHKGFETVTIVYSGEVEHRDSAGGGGSIGPGDVQWMTAASGLIHEEMHGKKFARRGGTLEMVQLWVNLPARDKKRPPRYQSITATRIPEVPLSNQAGLVRVIAGSYQGVNGPAETFTPMNVWDVRLTAGHRAEFIVPTGHHTLVLVLNGEIHLSGGEQLSDADLAIFDQDGDSISLQAQADSKLLILDGEPIHEPVAAYGPFVMNTTEEIQQAIKDFQSGRMGRLDS